MVSRRILAPALLLLLAGCVSGPDYKPPVIPLPTKYSEGGTQGGQDVAGSKWWTKFNDHRLDALVADGLSENLNILQALERINAARANVTSAGAGALPSLTVGASHTTSGQFGNLRQRNTENEEAGNVQVSWLLDVFGQYRRAKESARASLDAAYSSVDVSRLTYLQDLVGSYINARYYQARISLAQDDLKSRRETLQLTQFQLQAGAASRLDVVQAKGLEQETLSSIPPLEISYRQAVHHIATLLDRPTQMVLTEMERAGPQPVFRGSVKTGVPADLIRYRPDIRVAERTLAASTAEVGVAISRLYPSISLSGSISPTYTRVGGGAHGSLTPWSFGPSLNLPIFDGGALRANVKAAESQARTDYLSWKSTVINATEEVENYLAAVSRDSQTISALRDQVKAYQEALQLSTASYKNGASSLLDVLDAQRSVSSAKASLAAAIQQSATDYVNLNVAIGAGYVAATPADRLPAQSVSRKIVKVKAN